MVSIPCTAYRRPFLCLCVVLPQEKDGVYQSYNINFSPMDNSHRVEGILYMPSNDHRSKTSRNIYYYYYDKFIYALAGNSSTQSKMKLCVRLSELFENTA